ncbi:MAG: hypothetical protein WD379_04050 [Dehalococcoidia bacterium]
MAIASSAVGSKPIWDQWWRIGGLMGVLFLVVFVAGAFVPGETPAFDDPVDEIREWFTDNGERYLVGNYLVGLAFVLFFIPFLASLRGLLAGAEGEPAMWSWVAFSGGLAWVLIGFVYSLFRGTLAYAFGMAEGGDPETIRTLMYLDHLGASAFALAFVPFVLGSSLVIARTAVLWRWLALLGLLVVVLCIIAGASPLAADHDGVLGGIGFIWPPGAALWLLIVSVGMILKMEPPTPAAA